MAKRSAKELPPRIEQISVDSVFVVWTQRTLIAVTLRHTLPVLQTRRPPVNAQNQSPQLLLFDLGGVVIELAFERTFRHLAHYSALSAEQIARRFEMDAAYREHERGERSAESYFQHLRESFQLDADDATIATGWNLLFVGEISETVQMLGRACKQLPCYGFSNSNPTHEAFWRAQFNTALQPFHEVFVSSTLGQRKPDRAAFELIASATGVALESMLFFDDTQENVLGARAAGLDAVQVESPGDVRRALRSIGVL